MTITAQRLLLDHFGKEHPAALLAALADYEQEHGASAELALLRVELASLEAYKTFHADTLRTLPQVASITSHISLGSSKDLRR